jgi:hypothetical protein
VLKYKTIKMMVIKNVSAVSATYPVTVEKLKARTWEESTAVSEEELQKATSNLLSH